MRVTIKDVAKRANVSPATVSLVINKNKRISEKTRAQVLKAIKDLNYHPSRSARGLVSKQSGNIGFILTEDHFSRSEPFYTKIFLGTEFQAREYEYYILLTTIPADFSDNTPLPRFILEQNVEGVILAGKVPSDIISRLIENEFPLAFVDYYPPNGSFPVVMIDNVDGGFRATKHLIDCNHKRIAYIAGDIEHPSISERFQGYKMALEKANIQLDPGLILVNQSYPDRRNGYLAAKAIMENGLHPTAFFACNDAMAMGALQYFKEQRIRVPEDISIIGFDDVEANLSLDPPLTTMRVPKEDMGIEVMRLMVDVLRNKSKTTRKVLVPVELIARGSTCEAN